MLVLKLFVLLLVLRLVTIECVCFVNLAAAVEGGELGAGGLFVMNLMNTWVCLL